MNAKTNVPIQRAVALRRGPWADHEAISAEALTRAHSAQARSFRLTIFLLKQRILPTFHTSIFPFK